MATRAVWDLLILPSLMAPPNSIKRVLILGLGGGAAVHSLNHFVQPDTIRAIELDKVHIQVAKKHFGIRKQDAELICADAIEWVQAQATLKKPEQYDLIIDDLYGEEEGEPLRAVEANADWCNTLQKLLRPQGMIVSNFISNKELRESAYLKSRTVRKAFKRAYRFANPLYDNRIAVFHRGEGQRKHLRKALSEHKELKSKAYQQTFSVKRLY